MSDEEEEIRWIRRQRKLVEGYLRQENVDHGGVGWTPAFHVHPCVALWAIQSKRAPGRVGWWALSGDLPTDYLSSRDVRTPREALRAFSRIWTEVSAFMIRGESHPDCKIGRPEQWPEMGPMLRSRAQVLADYAADDGLWED